MITEVWVWYDELIGGVPATFVAIEMGGLLNARFIDFYDWEEVHGSAEPFPARRSVSASLSILQTTGFLLRPLFPHDWSGDQMLELLNRPGVHEVEVKGVVWGREPGKMRLAAMRKKQ